MSTLNHLRHWSALEKTDPSATKAFNRAGGFRGTATKPIYQEKKMTEHFGPCGVGWGMDRPEFQLVSAENEMLVFCTVALWYKDSDGVSERIFGVGGDKVIAKRSEGHFNSDEAFKAAFTDALGNAMKHIGVGADVHMGEFDKYGREEPAPRPLPAERAGNGKAATSTAQSPIRSSTGDDKSELLLKQAANARDRIRTELNDAKTPTMIDEIIKVHRDELLLIKDIGPKTYANLMELSTNRKNEMYANA